MIHLYSAYCYARDSTVSFIDDGKKCFLSCLYFTSKDVSVALFKNLVSYLAVFSVSEGSRFLSGSSNRQQFRVTNRPEVIHFQLGLRFGVT